MRKYQHAENTTRKLKFLFTELSQDMIEIVKTRTAMAH